MRTLYFSELCLRKRSFATLRLLRPLLVIESKTFPQSFGKFGNRFVVVEADAFMLLRSHSVMVLPGYGDHAAAESLHLSGFTGLAGRPIRDAAGDSEAGAA